MGKGGGQWEGGIFDKCLNFGKQLIQWIWDCTSLGIPHLNPPEHPSPLVGIILDKRIGLSWFGKTGLESTCPGWMQRSYRGRN